MDPWNSGAALWSNRQNQQEFTVVELTNFFRKKA